MSYKNQKTENSAQPGNSESNYSFYRAAVGTAVVAGVFSVLVCLLLVRNHFQSDFTDKLESEQLEKLKEQLLENPKDELLKSRIRTFDLELRNEFFRRQKIADRGKYILLGGLIIFLLSLKIAFNYRKKSPIPRLDNTDQSAVVRTTFLSVTILAAAAVGLATFLIMTGDDIFIPVPLKEIVKEKEIVHEQPDAAKIVDYPTPEQLKKNWPRFRGPGGMGISAYTNIPKSWNGKSGESIRWKTAIPMPGENSPVVWGNRIFLNSADEKNRQVYCFDADSGSILWQKEVDKIPRRTSDPPRIMEETGFAAATAVTDGLRVYAIFANGDLICFDFKGNRVWARNLGLPENVYGFSTSLDMYQKLLLVQYDQAGEEDGLSELLAIEGATGEIVWRKKRPVANTWTSPIIIETPQSKQFITCAPPFTIAYQPQTGEELWRAECLYGDLAPSPVYADGMVFVVSPYSELTAIRTDGRGDVTKTHIAWVVEDGVPDIVSPLIVGKMILLLTTDGYMNCFDITDGSKIWEKELDMSFRASPSLVQDKIYFMNEKGLMIIIEAGREYKEIARADLGESASASPAFADGRIYIRGKEHLYCIENDGQADKSAATYDWPNWRGPQYNGISEELGWSADWPKEGPRRLWQQGLMVGGLRSCSVQSTGSLTPGRQLGT